MLFALRMRESHFRVVVGFFRHFTRFVNVLVVSIIFKEYFTFFTMDGSRESSLQLPKVRDWVESWNGK